MVHSVVLNITMQGARTQGLKRHMWPQSHRLKTSDVVKTLSPVKLSQLFFNGGRKRQIMADAEQATNAVNCKTKLMLFISATSD